MLSQVGDTLLGDDDVRLNLDDVVADLLHLVLLLLKKLLPVSVLGDLDAGLALTLLVLQGAIQEDDARVLDDAAHSGVRDVLVEHHSIQDHGIRKLSTRQLLDLGVSLQVDLLAAVGVRDADSLRRFDGEVGDEGAVPADELRVDASTDDVPNSLRVVHIDGIGDLLHGCHGVIEGLHVAAHDEGRVQLLLQERLCDAQELAREHDDGGGTIPDLLVLCSTKLDHVLGCWVSHIDLSKDRVAVVSHHNATHGVQEHLQHSSGTERGADDAGDSLAGLDVGQLGLSPLLALRVLVQHEDAGRRLLSTSHHHGFGAIVV
mmetsp:Transcript_93546/g.195023  ORF Transcript_93546/g.195023 Transcript_93546/m.195023 type:complete len:317 (-) Transcript_93546:182-1132(-)